MIFMGDLIGVNLPVIRDTRIYDAANLDQGELLMLGSTDVDTGDDGSSALVTAYDSTPASAAVDTVGILDETTYEVGGTVPGGDFAPTTSNIANELYFGSVVTNPLARYKIEYSQAAAFDQAITSTSGTTLTIGSITDDKTKGCWVYFPLTQTGVKNYLRFIVADASGSCTMDSALGATGTSSDTVIITNKPNTYLHDLASDGIVADSEDVAGNEHGSTNIMVIDTMIESNKRETQYLGGSSVRGAGRGRPTNFRGLGPLDASTKLFAEICLLDKLYDQE